MLPLQKVDDIEDCLKIRKFLMNRGYDCTLKQAEDIWQQVSDDFCASWLCVPDSEEEFWEGYIKESF